MIRVHESLVTWIARSPVGGAENGRRPPRRKMPSSSLPHSGTWSKLARRSVLHAISVVATALTQAWSRVGARTFGAAESDRLRTEIPIWPRKVPRKRVRSETRWTPTPAHESRSPCCRASRRWPRSESARRAAARSRPSRGAGLRKMPLSPMASLEPCWVDVPAERSTPSATVRGAGPRRRSRTARARSPG